MDINLSLSYITSNVLCTEEASTNVVVHVFVKFTFTYTSSAYHHKLLMFESILLRYC